MQPVLIVGAGLAGASLARALADAGVPACVIDKRHHIAGLCYSSRDPQSHIDMHRYGPHIFHSSKAHVIEFVKRFDTWVPWVSRVKARTARGIFSMPINLHTINQLFHAEFTPAEARAYIETLQDKSILVPANAEEQLLRYLGAEIYENFFLHYSVKQWGVSPKSLAADVVQRIPIRFDYNDNYFNDSFQALPRSGYTSFVANMLNHPLIELRLGEAYTSGAAFAHVFYSGAIDEYYNYEYGQLSYRSLRFAYERGMGDMQGCACLNNTSAGVGYTRSHEHKYFSPWERHEQSILVYEYSYEAKRGDERYYPKRLRGDMEKLAQYRQKAQRDHRVSFMGRLGGYRYLDMDEVIEEGLGWARRYLRQ